MSAYLNGRHHIILHGINHKDKTTKDGKPYKKCGIKYRGLWYNGPSNSVTEQWQEGMAVEVDLWSEKNKNDPSKEYGYFYPLVVGTQSQQMPPPSPQVSSDDDIEDDDIMEGQTSEQKAGLTDLPF